MANSPPDGTIHGVLVPCSKFLDGELTEEKKKELWIEVVADNTDLQNWIEVDINYKGTLQNNIYLWLIDHPNGKVEIKEGNVVYNKETVPAMLQ